VSCLPVPAEGPQYGAALVGGQDSGEGAVLPHFGRLGGVGHEESEDLIGSGSQGGAPESQPVGGHRPGVDGAEAFEVLLGLPENQIGLSHEAARDRSVQPARLESSRNAPSRSLNTHGLGGKPSWPCNYDPNHESRDCPTGGRMLAMLIDELRYGAGSVLVGAGTEGDPA
jgi:hypothetical protein